MIHFSFIVPVYNISIYLEECITSLLNQTEVAYEIILIDDGSDDMSPIICDKYQQLFPKKIKVIHQVNQGLSEARNCGIRNAIGHYLIFIDGDDYVKNDFLKPYINGFYRGG